MRKKQILLTMFIFGFLISPITLLSHPSLVSSEDEKPMPMELNNTEWEVTTTYVTSKGKKKTGEDKLVFADKQFISKNFDKKGYDPTNYSLTVQDDGTTQFGTMQIKGKDTSFWKGTIEGDSIKGSVHIQFDGGTSNKTTYFNGTLLTGELKRRAKRMPTPPKAPPPPVAEVQTEEPAKKPMLEKAKEAVSGAVEKVQDLVGSGSDDAAEKVVDQSEETDEAQ